MAPSGNKPRKESSDKSLNNAHLVVGVIVGLLTILGFFGIKQISDFFPASPKPTVQSATSGDPPTPGSTLSAISPTLANFTKTSVPIVSLTPTSTSIPPTFTDTPQPTVATAPPKIILSNPDTGQFLFDQPLETSVSGMLATLKSIEILPTGAMRWHFEFWNKSNKAVRIRPTSESFVADEQGTPYALTSGFNQTIQPSIRIETSADFDAPKPGASVFTLRLINYFADLAFKQPTLIVPVTIN